MQILLEQMQTLSTTIAQHQASPPPFTTPQKCATNRPFNSSDCHTFSSFDFFFFLSLFFLFFSHLIPMFASRCFPRRYVEAQTAHMAQSAALEKQMQFLVETLGQMQASSAALATMSSNLTMQVRFKE